MSQPETVARHEGNGTLEKPAQEGRDSKGRFCKGNPGGPGNPFARQVAQLRQVFVDRVDEDKLEALVDMLLEKALAGDVAATKLVLAYTLGRPAVTSLVIGARTSEQLADNLAAADLTLTEAERAELDKASAPPLLYPYWHQAKTASDRLSAADLTLLGPHLA